VTGDPRQSGYQTINETTSLGQRHLKRCTQTKLPYALASQDLTVPGHAGPKTLLSGSGLGATAWFYRMAIGMSSQLYDEKSTINDSISV
jgi:hypothetical protein